MTMQLDFLVQQLAIHSHLKPSAIRRYKSDRLDYMLIMLEQFFRQAHGPTGVVSDRAVNNFDLQHKTPVESRSLLLGFGQQAVRFQILDDYIIEAIPAKTPALFRPQGAI